MTPLIHASDSPARRALERGRAHLLSLQNEAGYWKAELETNVTMDAEDLMLRQFLGIRGDTETREAAAWIRSQQQAGGGWGIYAGGPADLSTTVEAYTALRLAGDPVDADHGRDGLVERVHEADPLEADPGEDAHQHPADDHHAGRRRAPLVPAEARGVGFGSPEGSHGGPQCGRSPRLCGGARDFCKVGPPAALPHVCDRIRRRPSMTTAAAPPRLPSQRHA